MVSAWILQSNGSVWRRSTATILIWQNFRNWMRDELAHHRSINVSLRMPIKMDSISEKELNAWKRFLRIRTTDLTFFHLCLKTLSAKWNSLFLFNIKHMWNNDYSLKTLHLSTATLSKKKQTQFFNDLFSTSQSAWEMFLLFYKENLPYDKFFHLSKKDDQPKKKELLLDWESVVVPTVETIQAIFTIYFIEK